MTIFKTQNSTYEVDHKNLRVRRVAGNFVPTDRFSVGDDEGWIPVASAELVHMAGDKGPSLLIEWTDGDSPTHTLTSQIEEESK